MKGHKKNLLISSGRIEDDDKAWDIKFWQSSSPLERAESAREMAEYVFHIKVGDVDNRLDRTNIVCGKLSYFEEE